MRQHNTYHDNFSIKFIKGNYYEDIFNVSSKTFCEIF